MNERTIKRCYARPGTTDAIKRLRKVLESFAA